MNRPLLLALDIGNVCVRIDHRNCIRGLGLAAIPQNWGKLATDYECGRLSESEFFAAMERELGGRYPVEEIVAAFNSILIEPVPGMVELVNSFPERNVRAVFFSDISPTHLARTRELFPAAAVVPDGVYSFDCGAQKPSSRMRESFEARFGRPDLYTDDREELIQDAKAHHWYAVRFTGADALAEELEKLGNAPCGD